jgi:hypothetical protein
MNEDEFTEINKSCRTLVETANRALAWGTGMNGKFTPKNLQEVFSYRGAVIW